MNQDKVVDLVNNHFTYKDWTVSASRSLGGDGNKVIVNISRRSPDTTPGSNFLVDVGGSYTFDPAGMDEMTVKAHILMTAILHEMHDACESGRFDGVAPFHPHTIDGVENLLEHFHPYKMLTNSKMQMS